MTNNVRIPATGVGDATPLIAANEVVDGTLGTVKAQYVKLMGGALGDTTKIVALYGGVMATGNYDGQTAHSQRVASNKVAIVDQQTRLVGPALNGSLSNGASDNFWVTARGTNSTSVIANQTVTLTGLTTNSDWCSLASVRTARFLTLCPNLFRGLMVFSSVSAANTTTRFGAITMTNGVPQNGYCFSVDGAGVVSVQSYSGGSTVLNAASGFNGQLGSTYSVPDTNMHVYEIMYLIAQVVFFVDGQVLHTATPTNVLLSGAMSLPIGMSVVNGTSPTSRVVTGWLLTTVRYGKEISRPQTSYIHANTGTLCKTGPGTLHEIIIGTPVNGATVTVADNTSGTTPTLLLLTSSNTIPANTVIPCNFDFFTGLFVTTSGTTDVTVVYD